MKTIGCNTILIIQKLHNCEHLSDSSIDNIQLLEMHKNRKFEMQKGIKFNY